MTEPLTSDHGKWRYDGLGVIFDEKNRRVAYLHNEQAGKRGDDTLKRIVDAVNNSANLRAQILAMQQTQSAEVVDLRAQLAQAQEAATGRLEGKYLDLRQHNDIVDALNKELAQVTAENIRLAKEWKQAHVWNVELVKEHYDLKQQLAEAQAQAQARRAGPLESPT